MAKETVAKSTPKAQADIVKTRHFEIPVLRKSQIVFKVRGTASLIVKQFGVKAITQMLAKQCGVTVEREFKSPADEAEACKYRNVKGQDCVPSGALRNAMVTAAKHHPDLTKTDMRIAFRIVGEYIPISFSKSVVNRLDVARNSGMGRTADIRFRPEYLDWELEVVVIYNPLLITPEQLFWLVQMAGEIGLCEWRPERNGVHGTFELDLDSVEDQSTKRITEVTTRCMVPRAPLILPDWVAKMLVKTGGSIEEGINEMRAKATGVKRPKAPKANGHAEAAAE